VRGALNPSLDIEGVLLTMYDDRTNLGQLVARDVRDFFKEKVFNTIIPRNVGSARRRATARRRVVRHEIARRAAYIALAHEMLSRHAA
jgi:chromosome partitioning protein